MGDGPLLCDPADKARREASNGVDQIDYIANLVNEYHVSELRESHVLELHRLAVWDIYPCAGQFRDARFGIAISDSDHTPPEAAFVPSLVREAIDHINETRTTKAAMERAAYALWRFNWIHPFPGGNGRTARALAYLILCMEKGMMLPGTPTTPTLIHQRKPEYVSALKVADAGVVRDGTPDLSAMSEFLRQVVTRQVASFIHPLFVPHIKN